MGSNIIEFRNITKSFPGVVALNNVSFGVKKGEIHCLCGENGAGKSTLINLCGGVFQPDVGEILIEGKPTKITSPHHAEELGIGIVYQEIPLCPNLSIAGNIFLGQDLKTSHSLLDWEYMNAESRKLLAMLGLEREPTEKVENLSVAEQSLVQIARVIYHKPKLLILDEPTASLSENQKNKLFKILQELRQKNEISILYVSHRLEEVFEIGDRITVLKDGQYVGTVEARNSNINEIVKMMVGREVEFIERKSNFSQSEKLLEVKGLRRKGRFENINFVLYKGEILGFAGFQGAGRTEVMRAVFGLDPFDKGEIYIRGHKVIIKSPIDAIKYGLGMISENRRDEGIIPLMNVKDNLIAAIVDEIDRLGFLQNKIGEQILKDSVEKLGIKISSPYQLIQNLSGGNQQKVIIGRWLAKKPQILICDEPTRGIDIGAKIEIHAILQELANEGMGIIVVSSELPEILRLCDRIIVMHEGRITGELLKSEASEEKIMFLAAGFTR